MRYWYVILMRYERPWAIKRLLRIHKRANAFSCAFSSYYYVTKLSYWIILCSWNDNAYAHIFQKSKRKTSWIWRLTSISTSSFQRAVRKRAIEHNKEPQTFENSIRKKKHLVLPCEVNTTVLQITTQSDAGHVLATHLAIDGATAGPPPLSMSRDWSVEGTGFSCKRHSKTWLCQIIDTGRGKQ